MADMGIDNANTESIVFICNVCGREFVPILLSGKCCGVDNKTKKEIIIPADEQKVIDAITALRSRQFISRQTLQQIEDLDRELFFLRQKKRTT